MDCAEYLGQGRHHEAWVCITFIFPGVFANDDSFVSRANPKNNNDHVILGVLTNKPRDFAAQMALNLNNGWAIVRTIVDMVLRMDEGKYVLVKDPNKSLLRLYSVPLHTFEEEDIEEMPAVEEDDE